ncbi:MAG: aldo/keto reductase [Kiritimatiellae bacterium]|jgi:methylglyoxal reductase|nr:aldo/keto reductase [Kiritimatiellia bacterium]
MQYRELGNSGIKVSAVAMGTWAIGGGPWWGDNDDQQSIKTIHAALDHGINLIDTAPVYGFGHSEKVVGEALRDRRDKAVLATKCGLWWDDQRGSYHFDYDGHTVNRSLSAETLTIEIERSLTRLQTECIDLLQTHWQSVEPDKTPIEDTMAYLMKMRDDGKIRAIGASNVSCAEMDEYRAAGVIVSNQPRYSMLDRGIESEVLPYCIKNNVAVLAYSPLEQGLLTGKIGMDYKLTDSAVRNRISWFNPENRIKVITMVKGWESLATKYNCTVAQLVIAWTIAQPGLTCALCGARKESNIIENAGAGDVEIQPEDIARMRADVEVLAPVI